MDSQTDEHIVDQASAIQIRHGLASVVSTGGFISLQAGHCGANAVVVSKAQGFLSILDDSERMLSSLRRRF
jgi:hypothetical protein